MNNEATHPIISSNEIDMFFNNSNLRKRGDNHYFLKPSPRLGDVLMKIRLGYKDNAGNYTIQISQKHYYESELSGQFKYSTLLGFSNTCSIWDFHPRYDQIMNHLVTKKMEQ